MIDILEELIGTAPVGFDFLTYIFSFVLVLFGLMFIYKIFTVLLEIF